MDGDSKIASGTLETEPPASTPVRYLRQYQLVERVQAYHPEADEHALNAGYVLSLIHI